MNACSGCEISILNIGDALLDLLPQFNFVHITALVDHKFFGQLGDGTTMEIPEAVVGIVSGGVRNDEHKHELEEIRKKVKFLIALGSCACYGGVPGPGQHVEKAKMSLKRFSATASPPIPPPTRRTPMSPNGPPPARPWMKWSKWTSASPAARRTRIGSPTPSRALLAGKTAWSLPERSVCDTCPVIRETEVGRRPRQALAANIEFNPEEGLDKMRCINEQGFLCMGPVTLAGCAGKAGVPRCIQARTPCRGCFGPIRKGARPMVDMMGALTSVGLDPKTLVDRRAIMNRYIGGHGILTALPARPAK